MNRINNLIYKIYTNFFHNNIELEITKIINESQKFFKKDLTIIDIGCFKGKFSEKLFNLLKKKYKIKFYLFDPNPKSKFYLKENKFNYTFKNIAIDNSFGSANFYINTQFEGSGSSLNPLFKNNKFYNFSRRLFFLSLKPLFKKIKVKKKKLSSIFKKENIQKVDLLKIDAEASELNILKSGEKYLSKCKIIYIEISEKKNSWEKKLKKIKNLLKKNFIIFKIFKIPEGSIFTNLKICDCIFIRKDILKNLKN